MRILLVTSFGFPHLGGLSRYMQLLKSGLEARGHYVEVLSLNAGWTKYRLLKQKKSISKQRLHRYIVQNNFRQFRQQTARMPAAIRSNELRRRALELAARHLGVQGFDVIHAQDITAAMAMAKLPLRNTKLVTTLHGTMAAEISSFPGRSKSAYDRVWKYLYGAERFGVLSSDKVIVPTSWMQRTHSASFDTPAQRMVVVHHGTDGNRFSPKRNKSSSNNVPIIFNGQRLERVKGHRYMLAALSRLTQYRWKANIAGKGSSQGKLLRTRNRMGLQKRVTFLGARKDIPSLLRQADIVVVPSLVETFGFAVVEAQLAGVPVIGFRTSGVGELIDHGKTGYLAPIGNSTALAEYVRRLLQDSNLRRRMGKAARARALRLWTLRRMVERTIQVYRTTSAGVRMTPPDNLMTNRAPSDVKRRVTRISRLYHG